MLAFLENWVFNIVILTILIILLEIILPSGKTRKFVKLISGFILIIALINPVLALFGKNFDFHGFEIAGSNYLDREEIVEKSRMLKESQMKEIAEVYRQKLIKQLEDRSEMLAGEGRVTADVIINEDYTSESFGEIKRIYLYIGEAAKKDRIEPVAKVEKIEISKGSTTDLDGAKNDKNAVKDGSSSGSGITGAEVDRELKKSLEEEISRVFHVDSENIVISAQ
ncbi:stage III sporulation protein AF [Pseudoclostridium thermosuccinogenes]|uniref:stage III sporulation protein AF n=1 Tax=Clostridium thermosuccinogenes TaxID=84032 RepID=UPI002FD92C82